MFLVKVLLTCSMMWRFTRCQATVAENAIQRLASRYQLSHGDPCGSTDDPSIVCCHGAQQSTLIYRTEECCNGLPVGEGQLCCDWSLPVPRASANHDSCCLLRAGGGAGALTYDSQVSFCDRDTGEVVPIPAISGNLMKLLMSESHAEMSTEWDSEDYPSDSSDPSSLPLLCSAGVDENRSVGPRWRGEQASCCGSHSYFPSRQTCCGVTLHTSPSESTLCCHQVAYQKGDLGNPCLATCGNRRQPFNRETDLCCDGVVHFNASPAVYCCGSHVIDTDTHGCCRERQPFLKNYMRCARTGQVERRSEGEFRTRRLCNERLPTWRDAWPAPAVAQRDLLQIQGRVLSVTVHQSQHPPHVQIDLLPSNVLNSPASMSLMTSERIRVIALLDVSRCHSEGQLREYLLNKTLTVLSNLSSLVVSAGKEPTVTIPSTSNVHLIILSLRIDQQY